MPEAITAPVRADPSPEQLAQLDALRAADTGAAQPVAADPVQQLDADNLFALSVAPDAAVRFDPLAYAQAHKESLADAGTLQKLAEVHARLVDRGFKLSDLPTAGAALKTLAKIPVGAVKQVWNYGSALAEATAGAVINAASAEPSDTAYRLAADAQRKVAENVAGTETAAIGLGKMASSAAGLARRAVGGAIKAVFPSTELQPAATPIAQLTPEQKVSTFFSDLGTFETAHEAATGHGAAATAVNPRAVPVSAENIEALAAGDPFSFVAMGGVLGAGGKALRTLVPAAVGETAAAAGAKLGAGAVQVAAKTAGAAGATATGLGKATRGVSSLFPLVGAVTGTVKAGPLGLLAGLAGGEAAARTALKLAKFAEASGAKLSAAGEQLAGTAAVINPYAQLAADVLRSAPTVAASVGEGAAFAPTQNGSTEMGFTAATSESPADTEGFTPFGLAFGATRGVGRLGLNVIQGQLLTPRPWGRTETVPAGGNFSALDNLHAQAIPALSAGQVQRVNAARIFGKLFGTEVFAAATPEAAAEAVRRTLARGRAPETISPEEAASNEAFAKSVADARGTFIGNMPTDSGGKRRVVILNDIDAAPHEAFHGFQDVLGDAGNRVVDALVFQNYRPAEWRDIGQRYATRLLGRALGSGESWMSAVLDVSKWGDSAAREKIYRDTAGKLAGTDGPEGTVGPPTPEAVQAAAEKVWADARAAGADWRSILTPEEAVQEANRYLAREIAAENFDAVAKNLGIALKDGNTLPQKLARVLAKTVMLFGGEPFSGAPATENLQIEPKFRVARGVQALGAAAVEARGAEVPKPVVDFGAKKPSGAPVTPEERAASAKEAAAESEKRAATEPAVSEVLRQISQAIASGGALHITYRAAAGEPGGNPGVKREDRRAVIEAFRDIPESERPAWEKTIWPDRVEATKSKGLQILGFSPENFAANAQRVARWLSEIARKAPDALNNSPYPIDATTGSFTADGWNELRADTRTFVENQQAGARGTGEALTLPDNAAELGIRVPPETGRTAALPSDRADFINLLFGIAPPETVRVSRGGRAPGNIVAQDIVAANEPSRISEPGRPRAIDKATGAPKEFAGFPGRTIQEVNPLRARLERLAGATGNPLPGLIEVNQRLNIDHIAGVSPAPAAQPVRGVTDTLRAGFAPGERLRVRLGPKDKGKNPEDVGFGNFWVSPEGKFFPVSDHRDFAADRLEPLPEFTSRSDRKWRLGAEAAMKENGWIRVSREREGSHPTVFIDGQPPTEKQKAAFEIWKAENPDGEIVDLNGLFGGNRRAQFTPQKVDETEVVAKSYAKSAGIEYKPSTGYAPVNEDLAKRIADFYESAASDPAHPEVAASYEALGRESVAQYDALIAAGITPERWAGSGEPYKSSADMAADVRDNKHLWFFPTDTAFGSGAESTANPLLAPSGRELGGKPLLLNDVFRVIHDYFGHTLKGVQFGPRGEFNAWATHAELFSPEAQGALAAETLAQNSWVNFGPHLRDAAGELHRPGDEAFKAIPQRPFAAQKNVVVPAALIDEAKAQFSPKDEAKLRGGAQFAKFFHKTENTLNGGANTGDIRKALELPTRGYEPELAAYERFGSNFQKHIATSIPGFVDARIRLLKGLTSVAKLFSESGDPVELLDITSSEGYYPKAWATLAQDAGVDARADAVDALPAFEKSFAAREQVPGVNFKLAAFGEPFTDPTSGKDIPLFDPGDKRYDIVHEGMGFQFFTADRANALAAIKGMLKPEGVFVTLEKFKNPDYAAREKLKDEFKAGFYSKETLAAKQADVLKSGESAVGMDAYQVDRAAYEKLLKENFEHVYQVYSSGNFAGYLASDSARTLDAMLPDIGSTDTKFSFEKTPREIVTPEKAAANDFQEELRLRGQFTPKLSEEPDAIAGPAVRERKSGKIVAGPNHPAAYKKIGVDVWSHTRGDLEDIAEMGFVTNAGEFLNRKAALKRAKEFDQVSDSTFQNDSGYGLESNTFEYHKRGQFAPKAGADDYKLQPAGASGISKAWILPDGKPVQLGGLWHHAWLQQNAAVAEKYGITSKPGDIEAAREAALRAGFARINYAQNSGTLTVEARARDWRKLKGSVERLVEENVGRVDNMTVHLLNEKATRAVDSDSAQLFRMSNAEKLDNIPLITGSEPRRQFAPVKLDEKGRSTEGIYYKKGWIAPNGDFYPLTAEHPTHEQYAAEKLGFTNLKEDAESAAYRKGWLRFTPTYESRAWATTDFGREPTTAQLRALRNWAIEDGGLKALHFDDGKKKSILWESEDAGPPSAQFAPGYKVTDYQEFWMAPGGKLERAPDGHLEWAIEKFKVSGREDAYKIAEAAGYSRVIVSPENAVFMQGSAKFPNWSSVPKSVRQALEDLSFKHNLPVRFDATEVMPVPRPDEPTAQFAPRKKKDSEPGDWTLEDTRARQKAYGYTEEDFDRHLDYVEWDEFGDLLPDRMSQNDRENPEPPLMTVEDLQKRGYKSLQVSYGTSWHDPHTRPVFLKDDSGKFPLTEAGVIRAEKDAAEVEREAWEHSRAFEHRRTEDYLRERAAEERKKQFSPRNKVGAPAENEALPGVGVGREYRRDLIQSLSKPELAKHFPEAVIPRSWTEKIPSDITGSPLYKSAGSEPAAVDAFAEKLVAFANESKSAPEFAAGARWYSEFTPKLKKLFGADAGIFAELLAATSPKTNPQINFGYAVDALAMFRAGKYDALVSKFNEGLAKVESGEWEKSAKTPAAFLGDWIAQNDLKPRQSNGQLFGQSSLAVLRVLARIWLDANRGPKTANFVENLLGKSHEATIDVWADRTMRRIGYQGRPRWRILPGNATGVSDADFAFSQSAFKAAAKRLGMRPDSLQGALWFAEKRLWADRGYGRLDLGDYRKELPKTPLLQAGVRHRLAATEAAASAPAAEQLSLEIEPRPGHEKTQYSPAPGVDNGGGTKDTARAMKKYNISFKGRKRGALGLFSNHSIVVEAASREQAKEKIYDTHEHVSGFDAQLGSGSSSIAGGPPSNRVLVYEKRTD